MSVSAVYCAVQYGYRLWGNAYQPSQGALAHTVWVFYMSKFYEFFDTVRKNTHITSHIPKSLYRSSWFSRASSTK